MDRVKINKDELITKLEENRGHHRAIFEQAMEGYRRVALEQVNEWVNALKNGENPIMINRLPVPEEHTEDYDVAIEMLRMSVDQEVEIGQRDFRCYVLDKWEWKERFAASNSQYTLM